MKFKNMVSVVAFQVACCTSAHATLIDRGGGMIYDDSLGITWLQDANYAKTSGYSPDGLMHLTAASEWVASLNYGGYSDWRLPTTLVPDPTCETHGGYVAAVECAGGEMGHLYYVTLGNVSAYTDSKNHGLKNTGPFVNFLEGHGYWSSTDYSVAGNFYYFHFAAGIQAYSTVDSRHYAFAVRTGDVTRAIPAPGTYGLVLAGLGIFGITTYRRGTRVRPSI